ncbi:hypothetical protein HZB07_03115 [Candidatus Saganbacteria bacterium]|nr:hypothetical protein [Candidatus Saganbacteria bacterium]
MFFKKHERFKDGKSHTYWSLMETIRTTDGPRQRALCYLGELNTSQRRKNPAKLWQKYMQLTEVEAVFRALKSELVVRPIWHQKENRTQAHILVAFLGYALWVTLKHTLKNAGLEYSPARVIDALKRIHSGDIVFTTAGNEPKYHIRLRRIFRPDEEQKLLLAALKVTLPEKITFDFKSKCIADF